MHNSFIRITVFIMLSFFTGSIDRLKRRRKMKKPRLAGLSGFTSHGAGHLDMPGEPTLFLKVRPIPRQSVSLWLQPAGLLASLPDRRPSRSSDRTVALFLAIRFSGPFSGQGRVTAAGPLPIFTGFPIIAGQMFCAGDRLHYASYNFTSSPP